MSKYDYHVIADIFIAFSNTIQDLITNLKLQKLMYYAQAWHLAKTGKRLFDGTFQAWVHGPVMFDLYNDYRDCAWNPIERKDLTEEAYWELRKKIDSQTLDIIDFVIDEYFGLCAYELEKLTHSEEPWQNARRGLALDKPSNEIIRDEWMIDYYRRISEH